MTRWERIFYPDMPKAETMKGWKNWRKEAKKKRIRYFIASDMPRWIRSNIFRHYDNALDWIQYRTTRRHHVLKLNIDPGFYDIRERILYANFALLEQYAASCAKRTYWGMQNDPDTTEADKELMVYCEYDMAIEHLNWEISLADPESEHYDEYTYGQFKSYDDIPIHMQAKYASVVKELYTWWYYRKRKKDDDEEDEFLKAYYKSREDRGAMKYYSSMFHDDVEDEEFQENTPEESELFRKHMDYVMNKEDNRVNEEDEMLRKLISIRQSLWM